MFNGLLLRSRGLVKMANFCNFKNAVLHRTILSNRIIYNGLRYYQNDDNYPYFGNPNSPNALPEMPPGKSSLTKVGNGSLEGTLGIIAIKNEYKDENRVSTIYVDT